MPHPPAFRWWSWKQGDISQDEAVEETSPTHIPCSRASPTVRAREMGVWEMETGEKTALASTKLKWRGSFFEVKNMALSEEGKSSNPMESLLLNKRANYTDKARSRGAGRQQEAKGQQPAHAHLHG